MMDSNIQRRFDNADSFLRGYIVCALWTGVEPPESDPMSGIDKDYDGMPDELTPELFDKMEKDCAAFLQSMRATIEAAEETGQVEFGPDCGDVLERAGHDFWLTRNHHGAGFWDGDWPEPMAAALTDASHNFRESDLYRMEDGRIGA